MQRVGPLSSAAERAALATQKYSESLSIHVESKNIYFCIDCNHLCLHARESALSETLCRFGVQTSE